MSCLIKCFANIVPVILLAVCIHADTLANCTYEDIRGTWVFELGPSQKEGSQEWNCSSASQIAAQYTVKVNLEYPDVAIDEFGNKGFWTIIYNQGFEVVVGGIKYFGFSVFKSKTVSVCDKVNPGWAHDVLGHDRRCFLGQKQKPAIKFNKGSSLRFERQISSEELVTSINKAQSSWTATIYPQFESMSREDIVRMTGGTKSRMMSRPKAAPITEEQEKVRQSLPSSFDWRNVDGQNFVSPVRNQEACGSCYAFASMAMAESRLQILTNNTLKHVFSPQDIVECSPYSQGCEGGFPYLIGGKYGEDFGLVEEKCNLYKGTDGKCSTDKGCARNYVTDYRYVGGYYGACNEVAMMEAIYKNGPVAVGFMVYKDFTRYKSGVYHHVYEVEDHPFEPFELTNHAVLIVGWGEVTSPSYDRYWIVKNSWGEGWGIDGYFWIRRGNDECGIESMAVESTPIVRFN